VAGVFPLELDWEPGHYGHQIPPRGGRSPQVENVLNLVPVAVLVGVDCPLPHTYQSIASVVADEEDAAHEGRGELVPGWGAGVAMLGPRVGRDHGDGLGGGVVDEVDAETGRIREAGVENDQVVGGGEDSGTRP
jgi:hypothetical protein